jgi:hypothetical protein
MRQAPTKVTGEERPTTRPRAANGPKQQRPRERAGAERADQGTEARRAAVNLLPVDGGDHGQERLVEEVANGRDQYHRQHERLGSHEPQSVRELGEVATSAALDRPPLAGIHRSGYAGSHEQRRDRERACVHEEHVRGADPGDQDAGEERAKHGAQPSDRTVTRVHALDWHAGQAREGGHEGESRRISLRVEYWHIVVLVFILASVCTIELTVAPRRALADKDETTANHFNAIEDARERPSLH